MITIINFIHFLIEKHPSQCIDILIVVDQLLTGFDSQYVNTLYLDKVLETDKLIQAISRTNRVYDREEKTFGIFRFYRKPYTMQKNLDDALRLYCEGKQPQAHVHLHCYFAGKIVLVL